MIKIEDNTFKSSKNRKTFYHFLPSSACLKSLRFDHCHKKSCSRSTCSNPRQTPCVNAEKAKRGHFKKLKLATNLIAKACNLVPMASNLLAMASNLTAMARIQDDVRMCCAKLRFQDPYLVKTHRSQGAF